jgi:hypothetical protein
VVVHFDRGTASLQFTDVAVRDWTTVGNSLSNGPSVPARISVVVRWSDVTRRIHVHDAADDFAGIFLENEATLALSTSQDEFEFESDPLETSFSHFAQSGKERNGRFFR